MLRFASIPLLVAALGGPAMAQNYFGKWFTPSGGQPTTEFYVSNTTGSNSNPGTLSAPFHDITYALQQAQALQILNPLEPVTINVLPSVYSAASGEQFPLEMPAFGVALESYNPVPADNPNQRSVIDAAGTSTTAVYVDRLVFSATGDPGSLPESVIHGLEIRGGAVGVSIAPHAVSPSNPSTRPVAVEVRRCRLLDNDVQLKIDTAVEWEAFNLIDDNDIGRESLEESQGGLGILELCSGVSSTFVRANRIQNHLVNTFFAGNGPTCRPRLQSNFIQLGETNVLMTSCDPIVTNNTIAFAIQHAASSVRVVGISFANGSMQLDNNILWNPNTPSGLPGVDLDLVSMTTVTEQTNDVEDRLSGTLPNVFPQFVGGDSHPGVFQARDLHLAVGASSPNLIDAGTTTSVTNLINPTFGTLFVSIGGIQVRIDVASDIDREPRILNQAQLAVGRPEIGADEVSTCRMIPVVVAGAAHGIDENGNTVGMSGGTTIDLDLQGTPSRTYALFMGMGFSLDPVFHQTMTTWGITNLEFTTSTTTVPLLSGTFPASGLATVNFTLPGLAADYAEGEVYLQLFEVDPSTQAGQFSRRMRLELNP